MRALRSSLELVLLASALPAAPLLAQATDPGAIENAGEIIVTATRQSQTLSRVPISISAYSQEVLDLKGLRSFEDVARFTPGVRFDPAGNSISIRGISSGAGAGTTGIYINDTPIQIRGLGFSSDNSLPAIFDLERVEVLRGPQGTLFGAGSEGGTVRYITPQPGLQDYTAYARAEVSTTEHGGQGYEGGVALGGPIIKDMLGFRISGWHRRDAGYVDHVDNITGAIDDKNINYGDVTVLRGALTLKPVEALTITPSVQYQRRKNNADDTFVEALSDRQNGVFLQSSPEYRGDFDKFTLTSIDVKYEFDTIDLISNTSFFNRDNSTGYNGTTYNLSYYQGLYLDGCGDDCSLYPFLTPTGTNPALPFYRSPSVVTNTQRVFTQEVRLQSNDPDAKLTWVAGVFYQNSRQTSIEELVDPLANVLFPFAFGSTIEEYFGYPLFGQNSYIAKTDGRDEQIAGFFDVTYALTDRLKVTAGARYANAKFSFVNFADGSQNGLRTSGEGKSSENPFTPKVGVSFQADADSLYYATWAKGFRVGGANPPVPVAVCSESLDALGLTGAPESYRSDTVRSIEVGAKNKLFDKKLQLAASIYDVKWSNIQQTVSLASCAINFTDNLGSARSRGFDLQATILPVDGLTIDAAIGYNDTRYITTTAFGPNQDRIVVNKGNAIEGPPWTVALGAQYSFAKGFYVRGDYQFQSRLTNPTPNRDPLVRNYDPALVPPDARHFVSLRAGTIVGAANISVFVDNLLDSAPLISRTHSDTDTLLFTQTTLRPRSFGLTLSYRR